MDSEKPQYFAIPIDKSLGREYGVIIVRTVSNREISLCVSLRHEGDVEIYIKKGDCLKVIDALQKAMDAVQD